MFFHEKTLLLWILLVICILWIKVVHGLKGLALINMSNWIDSKRSIFGSIARGTKQTHEMLDYCAANQICADIEITPIQYANKALEGLINKDVKYRFAIDIENTLNRYLGHHDLPSP